MLLHPGLSSILDDLLTILCIGDASREGDGLWGVLLCTGECDGPTLTTGSSGSSEGTNAQGAQLSKYSNMITQF